MLCMLKVSMAQSMGILSGGFVLQNWLLAKTCYSAMFPIFPAGSQTGFRKGNKCKTFDLGVRGFKMRSPPLGKVNAGDGNQVKKIII